jgi:hypothetical protein
VIGIARLSATRHRVFLDLGRDRKGKRVQYTQVVNGDRAEAERVEAQLKAVRDSVTASPEGQEMVAWLEGIADEADQRARTVDDERLAIALVDLAIMARELGWGLDRAAMRQGAP